MTTYAAFLRGINVGGAKKVPMADLRALAQDLGFSGVATYINSGNLIFASPKKPTTLEKELAAATKERFGFGVDVCVRSRAQLERILRANPFPDGDPSKVTIAFLASAAPAGTVDKLAAVAAEHEPFVVAGTEVYVHYGQGLGKSELAERFGKLVGVSTTVRNVRTVEKVLGMMN
jgi:uncharacterized protein (DUF1697 family)